MIYALRLGDVDTGEGAAAIYLGLTETSVLPPAIAQSDEDGLRQLLAKAGGVQMVCEPALARAAKRLVLDVEPQPAWTLIPCAELATLFHLGPAIERPALAAIVPALAAACEFVLTAPWQHFTNSDAIDFAVELATGRRELEGCIMGAGGQEFGVALYDQRGSLDRLAALGVAGRMQEARQIDAFGLTIDSEPGWVATAVERAFGAPVVLGPMRLRRGAVRPVSATDLRTMAGAMAAAAKLHPEHLEARATFGEAGEAITVVASVRGRVGATKAPARRASAAAVRRPRAARTKPKRHR